MSSVNMKPVPRDFLGTHVSIAGGVELAPRRGRLLGCSAIQIFSKSNRQWSDRPLSEESARAFRAAMRECRIDAAIAHSSYLINLAATDREIAEKSIRAMVDEIERCEMLGIPGLVVHPGSHLGAGERRGIATIAKSMRTVLRQTRGCEAMVLLENVAGQGTNLGHTWEQLAEMRERIDVPERVGFCLDTCHAHAAGHDIRTPEGYAEVMDAWDDAIGLEHIRAFHLNDSKKPLDSRRDRHEHVGRGELGLAAFHSLLNDPRFVSTPKVLETPKRDDGHEDRQNLRVLRRLIGTSAPPSRRPTWKTPEEINSRWATRLRKGL
jgi:deoxyribonuclease IV